MPSPRADWDAVAVVCREGATVGVRSCMAPVTGERYVEEGGRLGPEER